MHTKTKKLSKYIRILAAVLALLLLTACGGRSNIPIVTGKSKLPGSLVEFSYSPGYSDMRGESHNEGLFRDEQGNLIYVVTDREYYDAPTVKTIYAFDEEGLKELEKLIAEYDLCALEKRKESDDFVTDYHPWSFHFTFEKKSGNHTYVSFGEYQKYKDADYEHMKAFMEAVRNLRGELIRTEKEGGEEVEVPDAYAGILELFRYVQDEKDIPEALPEDHPLSYEYNCCMADLRYWADDYSVTDSRCAYALLDLDGDGIEELLIGRNDSDHICGGQRDAANVIAVYTLRNGDAVPVIFGWSRSSYHLLDNGHFLHYGSNGASDYYFGEYALDGTEIRLVDEAVRYLDDGIYLLHQGDDLYEMRRENRITKQESDAIKEGLGKRLLMIEMYEIPPGDTSSTAVGTPLHRAVMTVPLTT